MDRKAVSFLIVGLLAGSFLTTAAFAWLSGAGAGGASRGDRLILKLAHSLPPAAPVHKAMERFAELVAQKSGGAVEVQIFPSGQLGSETETIEQLQRGALGMVKTSTAALEGFVPEMALFGVPYLFRSEKHFWRVIEGPIGSELLAKGEAADIHGLCYYDAGARSFYTVPRAVTAPSDLAGLKIRTQQSATAIEMVAVLGGSAAAIPFGELYTALQQGMVDGAENNPPSVYDSRHWEVAKHFSLDEHARVPDMLVFSQPIWKKLPDHVRTWITEAARESAVYQREIWAEYVAECLAKLEAEGVAITHPDQQSFQSAVVPMYDAFAGTPIGALIERVQAVE
jgi:tripartite ATP-independent transporter DctP family solute receptor